MAVVGYVLLAFGLLNIGSNIASVVETLRTKKFVSLIPLIGGLFTFLGCLPTLGWKLGLVGFAIDPGFWICVTTLVFLARSQRGAE